MARIYQALEILKDGKGTGLYRFTVHSDEESWPAHAVGCCAQDCPGHPTKGGAELHWKQYRFDQHTKVGLEAADEQKKCQVCSKWTTGRAAVDDEFYREFVLCPDHNNTEVIRDLMFSDEEKEEIRKMIEGE